LGRGGIDVYSIVGAPPIWSRWLRSINTLYFRSFHLFQELPIAIDSISSLN
jgi:hypothetical protein